MLIVNYGLVIYAFLVSIIFLLICQQIYAKLLAHFVRHIIQQMDIVYHVILDIH